MKILITLLFIIIVFFLLLIIIYFNNKKNIFIQNIVNYNEAILSNSKFPRNIEQINYRLNSFEIDEKKLIIKSDNAEYNLMIKEYFSLKKRCYILIAILLLMIIFISGTDWDFIRRIFAI